MALVQYSLNKGTLMCFSNSEVRKSIITFLQRVQTVRSLHLYLYWMLVAQALLEQSKWQYANDIDCTRIAEVIRYSSRFIGVERFSLLISNRGFQSIRETYIYNITLAASLCECQFSKDFLRYLPYLRCIRDLMRRFKRVLTLYALSQNRTNNAEPCRTHFSELKNRFRWCSWHWLVQIFTVA